VDQRHLILVGPMGSGKTTVGRELAARLGRRHRDTDAAVADGAGCSVEEIFRRWGEAEFRRRETDALVDILDGPPSVISTGGGIVVADTNRAILSGFSTPGTSPLVVWLDAGVDALVKRVRNGRGRPLLQGDLEGNLTTKVAERAAFYNEVADIRIDTTEVRRTIVVDRIVEAMEEMGGL